MTVPEVYKNSCWGAIRGVTLEMLLFPLMVTKIRQQCSASRENSFQIAKRLFQEEGWKAFYQGLAPQLLKTTLKHAWIWPMVTHMPGFFGAYGFEKMQREVLTGLLIATAESMMVPLERMKIVAAFTGKSVFSTDCLIKRGWQGFGIYWAKHSVSMVTFLTAQEHLRSRWRKADARLSLHELIAIGAQVACIVSFVSAPFDVVNTLKQTQQLPTLGCLFSRQQMRRLYRGFPLNTALLTAHSIASVVLIESIKPTC